MSNNGTPLRVIPEVSGHRNLEQFQVYIEVRDDQVLGAVTGLSMLSPVKESRKLDDYLNGSDIISLLKSRRKRF